MTASRVAPALALLLAATWPAAAQHDAIDVKVLTFNVWHGLRSGESNKRFPGEDDERASKRFDWQIEEIERLDPDILLFQEVNPNQRQSRRYAEALGYDGIHKVTSCGLHLGKIYKIPKNMNEGLAILARPELKLREVGSKRLSGNAKCTASWGIQTRESRYVLFGAVTVGGREVLVVTTHLSVPPFMPPGFEEDLDTLVEKGSLEPAQRDEIVALLEAKRAQNLDEGRKLLEQIDRRRDKLSRSGDRPPVILGGDFNTESGTDTILLVEGQLRNVATGTEFLSWDPLTNAANMEIGTRRSDPVPTFDNPEVQALLAPRKTIARQIDFIFVSDELQPSSAAMEMNRERDGIYPSDHFAILTTIRLTN